VAGTKLADLIGETGFDVHDYLDREALIPVNGGLQAQGDLLIIPTQMVPGEINVRVGATWVDVPAAGVELLRGTAMGNAHTLLGGGRWTTDVSDRRDLALGVFESDVTVWIGHVEHGYLGVAPGRYVVRRQREQSDEIRLVQD
jgi:hypothetical protein